MSDDETEVDVPDVSWDLIPTKVLGFYDAMGGWHELSDTATDDPAETTITISWDASGVFRIDRSPSGE